jgi:hypothetical protein
VLRSLAAHPPSLPGTTAMSLATFLFFTALVTMEVLFL